MKEPKHIVIFVLAIVTSVLLFSCGHVSMEDRAPAMATDSTAVAAVKEMESESDLVADSLRAEQLQFHTEVAMQKLRDYYDCWDILSSQQYDSTLRMQALEMASGFFYGTDKKLNMANWAYLFPSSDSVKLFNIQDRINQTSARINDTLYLGALNFRSIDEKNIKSVPFSIRRINKQFGTEQKVVWETFLELDASLPQRTNDIFPLIER